MNTEDLKIIGTTGMPGSGKTIFAEIAKEFGYTVVIMGDVVRRKVGEAGKEPTPENCREMMFKLREIHGDTAIAYITFEEIEKIMEEGIKKIVIDGIRSQAEVIYFREKIGKKFHIVAIHVDPELRFDRLKKRGREDLPQNEEEFMKRDQSELKLGVAETIVYANSVIPNNEDKELFKEKCIKLLTKLGEDKK